MRRLLLPCALAAAVLLLLGGCAAGEAPPRFENKSGMASQAAVATTVTPEGFTLSCTIPSDLLVAGTGQSAAVTLVNSVESTQIAGPEFRILITDASGAVVYETKLKRLRMPPNPFPAGAQFEETLTFTVPSPGVYLLYGLANESRTPAIEFRSVAQ